jgi:hypothetical protein
MRKHLRFSLRAVLAAVAVCSVWLSVWVRLARQQAAAVASVRSFGGTVEYDYERTNDTPVSLKTRVSSLLGRDLVSNVTAVNFDVGPSVSCCAPRSTNNDSDYWPDDDVMDQVSRLRLLRSLYVPCANKLTRRGIVSIARSRELRRLVLVDIAPGDSALEPLGALANLHYLEIWCSQPNCDHAYAWISDLRQLRELRISCASLNDEAVNAASTLRNLNTLSLYGNLITDAGIANLMKLPAIRELHLLSNSRLITDKCTRHIAALAHLERLTLSGAWVSDVAVQDIAALATLRAFDIFESSVTDGGLAFLASCHSLESVDLWRTRITARGVRPLMSLPKLTLVGIRETAIPAEDLQRLRAEFNGVTFDDE